MINALAYAKVLALRVYTVGFVSFTYESRILVPVRCLMLLGKMWWQLNFKCGSYDCSKCRPVTLKERYCQS
jgi:hypothetical protein